MYFTSKEIPLLILGFTAIVFSRVMFVFFNDPEGPNLLVVTAAAVVLYALSLAAYFSITSVTGNTKLVLVIVIQILLVTGSYFLLR